MARRREEQDLQDLEDTATLVAIIALLKALENRLKRRKRAVGVLPVWKRRREQGDGYNLLPELRANNPSMFFNYTRITYERFDYLLQLCTPYLTRRDISTAIPPDQRLALTIRYLATGDNLHSLAFAFRCGFSTASRIVRETLPVIHDVLLPLVVRPPNSEAAWKRVAAGFYHQWNLPNCLGAIDGRHMQIRTPKGSGSTFINYKKTSSIVLLAVANYDCTFLMTDVGAEGSQNDATILNSSEFWERMKSGRLNLPEEAVLPNSDKVFPYYFVGDGIFALQKRLMKPYGLRKLTQEEAVYNYRISRARRVVENAFGILVARWQIFLKAITGSLQTAEDAVLAALCLHNYIMRDEQKHGNDAYMPTNFVDQEDDNGNITPGEWRNMIVDPDGCLRPLPRVPRRGPLHATRLRETLQDYVNNEGAVDWQVDRVRKGFWGAHITADLVEADNARRQAERDEQARVEALILNELELLQD